METAPDGRASEGGAAGGKASAGKAAAGRAAVVMVSVLLSLVGAELWLARFRPVGYLQPMADPGSLGGEGVLHRASPVPGLAYELTPDRDVPAGGTRIRTNGHGMRDDEPADDASACNVVALGDSFTFGFHVDGEDAWPSVLERLLADSVPERRVQVLNFGVGGYSTRDEALVLRHKGLRWRPRLVVIGYVLNDPETDPVQPLHRYFHRPAWWQRFHVGRLVAEFVHSRELESLGGGSYIRYLHAGRKWRGVLDAFADIRDAARGEDAEVLLVVFPLSRGPWPGYPHRDLHAQVTEAARAHGFHTLDLLETFSAHRPRVLTTGDAHPSAFAHGLAAEAIRETIEREGILRCP